MEKLSWTCNVRKEEVLQGVWVERNMCFWRDSPPVGQDLLIHEVSRSLTTTHHSR
jgi:hypothetical protein